MLAYFDVSIGWKELAKRTFKETVADNGLGLAAQLAYYFFLALFPALLFLIALAGLLPTQDLMVRIVEMLGGVAPPDIIKIITEQLTKISEGDQSGILTFGVAAALWSSSAAMVALMDALNRAYDVEDARPWWKQRLISLALTVGISLLILVSFALVVAGPELATFIANRVGLGLVFEWTWKILQWPLVFALVASAVTCLYYFAPDVDQDFVWLTPGSALATLLWLIASLGFRFYVTNFGSYNETYGAIGGVMVLLLWLYLTGLVLVVGAEMSAEIEHASPHGKAPGEKMPGERTIVGPRAARLWRRKQHAEGRRSMAAASHLVRRQTHGNTRATEEDTVDPSMTDVVRTAIHDAQELIRSEIALAKAEFHEEVHRMRTGVMALAAAAFAGVIAAVFLLTTGALALADVLDQPLWVGFAIVTCVALLAAITMALIGRRRLSRKRIMPLTMDTMKENTQWMRARTS